MVYNCGQRFPTIKTDPGSVSDRKESKHAMNILIVGAGAMGGLFASLLAPLADICLFTTNIAHARPSTPAGYG